IGGNIRATKVVNAYSLQTAKHPSPLRKWMFFFQSQQHSLYHLKEKTISRKKRYSIGGEFSVRMD
ncbi:hypothetical protein SB748_31570, partial [Rhizobium sp. SIMBA_035]